ncbi:MAG: glycosyltransferase [candidate division Zixibacteria bacterium]|nr:glycosyltransferase [Candidatus Tariuqbacter arcticus]
MRRFKPSRYTIRRRLDRDQRRSPDEINMIQWRRLKKLLAQAYGNVPYYRKCFEERELELCGISTLEDFRKLPFLRKTDIQRNFKDLTASNYNTRRLKSDSTGGSTGYPINFYHDSIYKKWKNAAFRRFRHWIGYESGDKTAFMWGAVRDVPEKPGSNQRWLNSFNCSPGEIETFVRELVEWKPKAIRGYASSLYLVASYIKSLNLPAPRPQTIESGAEKLWNGQRAVIEDVFQCQVFEQYGSREIPAIGCECELHNGMHIFNDIRLLEIIRDGEPAKPGEEGSIIITDLMNYVMPFIRYEIGDIGVMAEGLCSCGRGFPLLKEVKGRIINIFPTPDGRYIYGGYFNHLFFHTITIEAFQVRQRSVDRVEVSISPGAGFKSKVMEPLISQMREALGKSVEVTWQIVDEIPAASSGKRHFTISDVPINFLEPSTKLGSEQRTEVVRPAKILFIVDAPKWAHDIKTDNLIRILGNDYDMRKRFQSEVSEDEIEDADLMVIYYWKQLRGLKRFKSALKANRHKLLLGVCSHHELAGKWRKEGIATLSKYAAAIFVNNMFLYKEFKSRFDLPLFYTPNGVDTDFFQPAPIKASNLKMRVGWAGSLSNQGDEHRGFRNYILPAVQSVNGVELVTAVREDKWRSLDEMREFYRSLDLYICASESEGTPNPCLEAAACGVPLITTRVGNMPELVVDGVNSLFIEREVKDIGLKMERLRDAPELRMSLSAELRKTIREWDWKIQAVNYREMFDSVLNR